MPVVHPAIRRIHAYEAHARQVAQHDGPHHPHPTFLPRSPQKTKPTCQGESKYRLQTEGPSGRCRVAMVGVQEAGGQGEQTNDDMADNVWKD